MGYDIVPSEKWDYVKDMMTTLVKRCVDAEREEVVVYVDKYKALKRKLLAVPGVKSVKQARDPVAYLRVTIMATAFYARTAFQDIFHAMMRITDTLDPDSDLWKAFNEGLQHCFFYADLQRPGASVHVLLLAATFFQKSDRDAHSVDCQE